MAGFVPVPLAALGHALSKWRPPHMRHLGPPGVLGLEESEEPDDEDGGVPPPPGPPCATA